MNDYVNLIRGLKLKHAEKSVLWILADRADERGQSFPGWDTLQQEASVARQTLSKALESLADQGLIHIEKRRLGGKFKNYKHNVYTLNLERIRSKLGLYLRERN